MGSAAFEGVSLEITVLNRKVLRLCKKEMVRKPTGAVAAGKGETRRRWGTEKAAVTEYVVEQDRRGQGKARQVPTLFRNDSGAKVQ